MRGKAREGGLSCGHQCLFSLILDLVAMCHKYFITGEGPGMLPVWGWGQMSIITLGHVVGG